MQADRRILHHLLRSSDLLAGDQEQGKQDYDGEYGDTQRHSDQ
jgi:hypothetical protein